MEMESLTRDIRSRLPSTPMVITLDGAAGTGKTSLAKMLADLLGVKYLDTGAMYRSLALRLGPDSWKSAKEWLQKRLSSAHFSLSGYGENTRLLLDGSAVGEEIRREQVGMWASKLAELSVVREHLTRAQQDLGNRFSLVAEGRDMGSVVFPEAGFKYFLRADPEERVKRRLLQLHREYGQEADEEQIRRDLQVRDNQDQSREVAPLRPAEDAVLVDTTDRNLEQVLSAILQDMQSRLL